MTRVPKTVNVNPWTTETFEREASGMNATTSPEYLDETDGWTNELASTYLARHGNLKVPCSRYGFDTLSCIPAAIRLVNLIGDANGEPITADGLEHAMGLVVNDHEDVSSILTEHGGTPDDYVLAAYECSICGDEHGESAHGDPLVQRDQSARTIVDAVAVYVLDGMTLCQDSGHDAEFQRLASLYDDWNAQDGIDGHHDEYAPEYLDDIDAILSDAGYHAITDGDQGTWSVYAPVASQVNA